MDTDNEQNTIELTAFEKPFSHDSVAIFLAAISLAFVQIERVELSARDRHVLMDLLEGTLKSQQAKDDYPENQDDLDEMIGMLRMMLQDPTLKLLDLHEGHHH